MTPTDTQKRERLVAELSEFCRQHFLSIKKYDDVDEVVRTLFPKLADKILARERRWVEAVTESLECLIFCARAPYDSERTIGDLLYVAETIKKLKSLSSVDSEKEAN